MTLSPDVGGIRLSSGPDGPGPPSEVVIFRWVLCFLCTPSREVHKKTYCMGPGLCKIVHPNFRELTFYALV